jgi:DHA1 family multidrug resistance protein-like MFS transporter
MLKVLASLLVATAFFRLSQNAALTTLSLLGREDLHLSPTAIGGLSALGGLVLSAVTILVASRVSLRHSAVSAAVGTVLLAASLIAFGRATSLTEMVVATLLLGAAGGLAMPGLVNAVQTHAGANRERAIAIYTITLSVSLALGPLLETSVLNSTHQDVRAPFDWFVFFPAAAALLLAGSSWHSSRRSHETAPPHQEMPQQSKLLGQEALPAHSNGGWPARADDRRRVGGGLFSTRSGRQALIVQLLYAIPFAGITSFGALVAKIGFGVTAAGAQLAFTAFFATSFAARALVAWRSPIEQKQPLLWASAGMTLFGLLLLGTVHGLVLLLFAMAVLGLPHGLSFPLALGLVSESTDDSQLPRANAALIGTTNLSTVMVPTILGAVIPAVGYRAMVLLLTVPVAIFTVLLVSQRAEVAHEPAPNSCSTRG